jgi:hypothetical protein
VDDVLGPEREIAGVLVEYANALGEIADDFHSRGTAKRTSLAA